MLSGGRMVAGSRSSVVGLVCLLMVVAGCAGPEVGQGGGEAIATEAAVDRPRVGGGPGDGTPSPPRATPESRSTLLLQGQRAGADYRFTWIDYGDGVWLGWEWHGGNAGQGQDKTWTGPRPDPMSGVAGPAWFVFGFATAQTARVLYQPPDGRPATPLQVFTMPDAGNLKAFGGFVPTPRPGSVVITYQQNGTELSRSVDLRWH
jgi:hypothetical protein